MSTDKPRRVVQPKTFTSDFPMRPLGCLRNKRDLDLQEDVEDVDERAVQDGDQNEIRPHNKRVIQLPMLKLNLESLTGSSNNEDNIALESTRKTLRTLIDDCKRSIQTTEIKNYEFISPVNNSQYNTGEVKSNNKRSVEKGRHRNRLPPLKRKESEGIQRKPLAKTPDAICSVAFTNQISDTAGLEYLDYLDGISPREDQSDDLTVAIIPETKSPAELPSDMASWNSYTDITPIRKGSYRGCSKHEYLLKKHRFQRELMEERSRARQDLNLSWVNINHSGYRASPIYRYTNYQQKPVPESSPQPQQQLPPSTDHCPMCTLYRSECNPTACPPNSPRGHLKGSDQQEETLQDIENQYSARSTDHFNDVNTLEPMPTFKLAQKQGFRGSKPPITFKMAFCK